jgi:periplasmic protein TonB
MRDRAGRALGYAVLASLLLHALALLALPSVQERHAREAPESEPLIARIERIRSPTPAPATVPEVHQPASPRPAPAAKPAREPISAPIARAPASQAVIAEPAPAPTATAAVMVATAAPQPVPAAFGIDADSLARYREDLIGSAARFKRYPRVAIDNDWTGEVVVRMAIGADGHIAALRVARGSGHPVLDRQALQMFADAKPAVPLPRELRGMEFELELRAIYSLRDARAG